MAGLALIISSICNATYCELPRNDLNDSWHYEASASVAKSNQAYINLVKEFNGKIIKVATYNNPPLSRVRKENGTLIGDGVAFQILNILKRKFNFTVEVVEPKKNYEFGGNTPDDSIVGLLNSSKVDMAAAFLPKLHAYREKVLFSMDLDEGVWLMMLKRPKESAGGSGLLAPFNSLVWYMVLAAVITFGPCITFMSLLRARLVPDSEQILHLEPTFWFVYSAFMKQGTSLAPEANTTRVLFVTWWLFMILLSAFYTANLTAFLTLSKFTLAIEKPKDLYVKNNRWVAAAGGSVEYTVKDINNELHYLNKMVIKSYGKFISSRNYEEFLDAVRKGAVFIKETTVIEHLMYDDYKSKKGVDETERCTYVIATKHFMKCLRGFAYPMGSKLKQLFDPVLSDIFQSGILDYLKKRDLPSTKICPLDLQSKDRKLRNGDLIMTYLAMGVGTATAATVFIAEVFIKRFGPHKQNIINRFKKKKIKPIKKRASRVDADSRPPPYDSLFGNSSKYNVGNSRTRIINGREYYVFVTSNGEKRLIPARAPSSFLYRSDR